VSEGEAGVRGAEARERAALVRVKEALGPGDGGQPDRHTRSRTLDIVLSRTMMRKEEEGS